MSAHDSCMLYCMHRARGCVLQHAYALIIVLSEVLMEGIIQPLPPQCRDRDTSPLAHGRKSQ